MTTRRLKMTMEEIVKCFCGAESAKKALEKDLACGVKRTPMAVKWGMQQQVMAKVDTERMV